MIPQIEPFFGEEEREAVVRYMKTGAWLTEFEKTRELEQRIAAFVGVRHCFMTPNCTLALYAAFTVLGVGSGDNVIVPAYTMVATANAVAMTGAEPVLVDVGEDICLDVQRAETAINSRTKAVAVVHLNGRSPDMEAVTTLAESRGLYIVEDAAQALGSQRRGRYLGALGNVGCYSFSPHKIISTGQGGCVVTNDNGIAEKIQRFRDFGRLKGGRHDHDFFGINLKFTDLQAVIGLEQLKKIGIRIDRKRHIYHLYRELLAGTPVQFPPTDLQDVVPWYVDITVDERDNLADFLTERGVETQKTYPVISRTGAYREAYSSRHYPVAELIADKGLWLPSSVTLTDTEIYKICSDIREYYT